MTSFELFRTADAYEFDSADVFALDIKGDGVEMLAILLVSFPLE
jgi:hypothetical protein